jgi:putative cardiolipin synthase
MRTAREALAAACLAAALALTGCAPELRLDAERPPSHAVPQQLDGPLKVHLAARIPAGESGFHLLHGGHEALAARLALAQRATHSLDVQYYLFHNDTSGKLVAAALLAAAERGVRVRMLIDDIDTADKEVGLATLNAHPNIQIRLFNPFQTRSTNLLVKGWHALRDSTRLNRRMHNKAFIADNQLAITGGRNIGDEYFDAHHDLAFVDLDVVAAGPIVDALSTSFDAYWSSDAAVPASALPVDPADLRLQRASRYLQQFRTVQLGSDYGRALTMADPIPALLGGRLPWVLAPADLIVDPPEKARGPANPTSKLLIGQLAGLWIDPRQRAVIVSPYFVPGPMGMAYFRYWRHQGVQIDVLTNAFAASDVPLVHAGYANYRTPLLAAGVNLYELKPVAEPTGGRLRDLSAGSSRASLHAKTFVFDDEHVFIGSFNFDPRSARLNTELGLVIHSPELARQVTAIAADAMRPERSYRPRLVLEQDGAAVTSRLQWHDVHDGAARVSDEEPETSPVQRSLLRVLQALPIEQHL